MIINDIKIWMKAILSQQPVKRVKGECFENFVLSLLPKSEYKIKKMTTSIYREFPNYDYSKKDPDICVEHIPSGKVFYIECKFRSDWTKKDTPQGYNIYIKWTNDFQLKKFNNLSNTVSVFVAIGIGTHLIKDNRLYPKSLFLVDLNRINAWCSIPCGYLKSLGEFDLKKYKYISFNYLEKVCGGVK